MAMHKDRMFVADVKKSTLEFAVDTRFVLHLVPKGEAHAVCGFEVGNVPRSVKRPPPKDITVLCYSCSKETKAAFDIDAIPPNLSLLVPQPDSVL